MTLTRSQRKCWWIMGRCSRGKPESLASPSQRDADVDRETYSEEDSKESYHPTDEADTPTGEPRMTLGRSRLKPISALTHPRFETVLLLPLRCIVVLQRRRNRRRVAPGARHRLVDPRSRRQCRPVGQGSQVTTLQRALVRSPRILRAVRVGEAALRARTQARATALLIAPPVRGTGAAAMVIQVAWITDDGVGRLPRRCTPFAGGDALACSCLRRAESSTFEYAGSESRKCSSLSEAEDYLAEAGIRGARRYWQSGYSSGSLMATPQAPVGKAVFFPVGMPYRWYERNGLGHYK